MSLRLRLTIIYSTLLSGVVLLLSIVVFSMVSVVITGQVDSELEKRADGIIAEMRADAAGGLALGSDSLDISNDVYYQVWSTESLLLYSSDNIKQVPEPMTVSAIGASAPNFKDVEILDESFRVLTVPLSVEGENYGWLQIGVPTQNLRYTQRLLVFVLGVSALFAIITGAVVGGW